MSPSASNDQRFLIVRTDRLGDVLLTLPMLSRIRASRPGVRITMLVRHYPGELLAGHPDVDELLWYDGPDGVLVSFDSLLGDVRSRRFGTTILVHPTPQLAWLVFRAGIPIRVGTGYRYYSFLFNRRVYEHRRRGDRHELECNLGLLGPLGFPTEPPGPSVQYKLAIPEAAKAGAGKKLVERGITDEKPLVIIHPGSGGSSRDWPASRFAELAAALTSRGNTVLVTGSASEQGLVTETVAAAGSSSVFGVAGVFSLQELASVIGRSVLFVGNSSGPLHLAAAMGTPVVGLYPQIPEIGPRRWGPYAANTRVIVPDKPVSCRECRGRGRKPCGCMASLQTETVLRASLEMAGRYSTADRGGRA